MGREATNTTRRAAATAFAALVAGWVLVQTVPGSADHLLNETVNVDSSDQTGSSTVNALEAGKTYVLRVSGFYTYSSTGQQADAECSIGENDPTWRADRFILAGEDLLDVYVDGEPVAWTPANGDCDVATHFYTYEHTPAATGQVTFKVADITYFDNSGTLTVLVTEKEPLPSPSVDPSPPPTPSVDPGTLTDPLPSVDPSPPPTPSVDPGTLTDPLPSVDPSPPPVPSDDPGPLPTVDPSPSPLPTPDPEPSPGPTPPPTAPPTPPPTPPTPPPTLSNPDLDPGPDPAPDPGTPPDDTLPTTGGTTGDDGGGTSTGKRTGSGSVRRSSSDGTADVAIDVLSSQATKVGKPSTQGAGPPTPGAPARPIVPAVALASLVTLITIVHLVRSRVAPRFVWTRSQSAAGSGETDLKDFWGRFDDPGDR